MSAAGEEAAKLLGGLIDAAAAVELDARALRPRGVYPAEAPCGEAPRSPRSGCGGLGLL